MTATRTAASRASHREPGWRRAPLAAALLLGLASAAGCGGSGTAAPAPSRTGFLISDFHFNPLVDGSLADRLAQAPASQWDSIFATSTELACAGYGKDSNFALLQSTLAAMQARAPNPDLIFVGGDFVVHTFNTIYDGAVTNPTPEGYTAFVIKTEEYLALKLAQAFPGAQIVPTLGDWDPPGGPTGFAGSDFLAPFAAAWSPAVNRNGAAPALQATFPTGGYYATGIPIDPKARLLVLYTQPWAAECSVGCASGAGTLGDTEMAWLTAQLAEARAQGQRVWLLGHIPPGISAPTTALNTAGGMACPASIAQNYAAGYGAQLYALLQEYGDIIAFGAFAHEHYDDFRLQLDPAGNPLFGMKGIPSITPLHGNNPTFVQFTYDPIAGVITDATNVTLTNVQQATTAAAATWTVEYAFDQTYGQLAFDANGLADAVTRIQTQPQAQAAYQTYFPSGNPAADPTGGFTPFLAYSCALSNFTVTDFAACYCGP